MDLSKQRYARGDWGMRISLTSHTLPVLLTLIILLLLVWLVMMVTLGSVSIFIHLLPVIAGGILLYRLFHGGRSN